MKTRLNRYIFIAMVAIVVTISSSCTWQNGNAGGLREKEPTADSTLTLVQFCREVNYGDTATLHDERKMKKMMSAVVKMLLTADSTSAREGLAIFFDGLRHDEEALSTAMELADKYLYAIGSPARNERAYINFLSTFLGVDSIPEAERLAATERLRIASLNRPGMLANDFCFELADGSQQSLYDIKSPMTLLIFYNPECSPCTKILNEIASDRTLKAATKARLLSVVAVYAEGKRDVWQDNLFLMPEDWTVGYDLTGILDNDLYNLPAMPTLYMLDADKRVILKDPDHRLLGKFLRTVVRKSMPKAGVH